MKIQILPMSDAYYSTFRRDHVFAQAPEFAKSFDIQEESAQTIAEENLDRSLPEKEKTKDHFFYEIRDESGEKVGHLWISIREFFGKRKVFISDIFVESRFRGQGVGKQLLAWVDSETKKLGYSDVALHVFGSNAGAQRLYDALGFQPTSILMSTRLY